jgi:hypothetical protein
MNRFQNLLSFSTFAATTREGVTVSAEGRVVKIKLMSNELRADFQKFQTGATTGYLSEQQTAGSLVMGTLPAALGRG